MNRNIRLMSRMSESAEIIKSFFVPILRKFACTEYIQPDGAEDKALPGGNLSADSGAKTVRCATSCRWST